MEKAGKEKSSISRLEVGLAVAGIVASLAGVIATALAGRRRIVLMTEVQLQELADLIEKREASPRESRESFELADFRSRRGKG